MERVLCGKYIYIFSWPDVFMHDGRVFVFTSLGIINYFYTLNRIHIYCYMYNVRRTVHYLTYHAGKMDVGYYRVPSALKQSALDHPVSQLGVHLQGCA